MWLENRSEAIQ